MKTMKHLVSSVNEKYWKWMLFVCIFFIGIMYSYAKNITEFYYDAQSYYSIADGMISRNFYYPETFRGYFFATLISLFKRICQGIWGWWFLSNITVAAGFAFGIPYLLKQRAINSFQEFVRGMMSYIFFLIIWGNYMQYPLSDGFAAICAILGVCFMMLVTNKQLSKRLLFISSISSGALLYMAYNTRAAYLYCGVAAIIIFLLFNKKNKAIVVILIMMIGSGLIAVPQCCINYSYTGKFTPKVYTENYSYESRNLIDTQVFWGLYGVKYDTYIGDQKLYESPSVCYIDPVGEEIIQREKLTQLEFEKTDLIGLFVKYPLDLVGIYARHLVALLIPSSTQMYITNIYNDKTVLALVSMILWIVAGMACLFSVKSINKNVLWIIAVLIPSLLQMLGFTELRFFIAVHMVTYVYVFLVVDYKALCNGLKDRWLPVVCNMIIIFVLLTAVYGNILASNQQRTMLINDATRTEIDGSLINGQ